LPMIRKIVISSNVLGSLGQSVPLNLGLGLPSLSGRRRSW